MKRILFLNIMLLGLCLQGLGKDNITTEERPIEAFDKITVDGVCQLYLTQADTYSLSVEVSEELQPEVSAKIKNGMLKISTSKKLNNKKNSSRCKIHVTYKELTALSIDGVCNAYTKTPIKSSSQITLILNGVGDGSFEFDAKRAKVKITGVGNLEFEGKAEEFIVDKSGVGNLDAVKLMAEKTSIKNSGVGNAKIYASGELMIENSGVGSITYYGDAVIKLIDSSGVGKIRKGK